MEYIQDDVVGVKPLPTIEYLRECFDVDFETGVLTWKVRPVSHFKDGAKQTAQHKANMWNGKLAGKVTGTPNTKGYLMARIDGRLYVVHRVVFAMAHGGWPKDQIDHINGARDDNRIANLRDVTHAVNQRNRTKSFTGGSSAYTGVSWDKRSQKWQAYIWLNGKKKNLGYFTDEIEAAAAYRAAAEELGYTEAHILAADGTMPPLPHEVTK